MTSGKDTTQHVQDNDISKETSIQERVANEAEKKEDQSLFGIIIIVLL